MVCLRVASSTIRYDNAILALNCLVGHSLGKVDGQEHRVHLPADRIKWRFEQHYVKSGSVVQRSIVVKREIFSQPVLSNDLSASSSGYLGSKSVSPVCRNGESQSHTICA